MRFSERDMANALAANANIGRMWGTADQALVMRRLREWKDDAIAAATSSEGRNPGHADPTPTRALQGIEPDALKLLHDWLHLSLKIEQTMPILTRSTHPTKEEYDRTNVGRDEAAVWRPRAGTCEICDQWFPGGESDAEKIHMVEGRVLCASHKRGRYKPNNRHRTIDNYVDSMRAMLGKGAA